MTEKGGDNNVVGMGFDHELSRSKLIPPKTANRNRPPKSEYGVVLPSDSIRHDSKEIQVRGMTSGEHDELEESIMRTSWSGYMYFLLLVGSVVFLGGGCIAILLNLFSSILF